MTTDEPELREKISSIPKQIKKRFFCPIKDCRKSYSVDKLLQIHIKNHTETKLYKCDYSNCRKNYKSKENLNLHIKNIHLE